MVLRNKDCIMDSSCVKCKYIYKAIGTRQALGLIKKGSLIELCIKRIAVMLLYDELIGEPMIPMDVGFTREYIIEEYKLLLHLPIHLKLAIMHHSYRFLCDDSTRYTRLESEPDKR